MESTGAGGGDKYRYLLHGDTEKDTQWRFGAPPNYDVVNKLFEEGRTKVWPPGSLEEKVQNLVKTWEMEIFHKTRIQDFKSVLTDTFTFSLNGKLILDIAHNVLDFESEFNKNVYAGRKAVNMQELAKLGGGYNPLLQTSLPEELRCYNPVDYDANSSHRAFTTAFPRGFALEILEVYKGPPVIVYKFRHWGYMEGPFKGHAPTGDMVEFYGIGILQVCKLHTCAVSMNITASYVEVDVGVTGERRHED